MKLEYFLIILLVVYALSYLIFGLIKGKKYLFDPPPTNQDYTSSMIHSEEIKLILAGLALTALALFINMNNDNDETIIPTILFFSISFSSLVISSGLTQFRTMRLFSYISNILSSMGLLSFGCGFLVFFGQKFPSYINVILIFIIFIVSYCLLSFIDLNNYSNYWAILRKGITEKDKLPRVEKSVEFFTNIFFSLCLIITALENIFTYLVLISPEAITLGFKETGFASFLIPLLGLEFGLITAFLISISLSFFFYFTIRFSQKTTGIFEIVFIGLGGTSLMNFHAALNDGLILFFGISFVTEEWKIYFIIIGSIIAFLINKFKILPNTKLSQSK